MTELNKTTKTNSSFGSSHGVNSKYAIETIIDYITRSKNIEYSFLIIHNDKTTLFTVLNQDILQLLFTGFLKNRGVLILTILSVDEEGKVPFDYLCNYLYECAKLLPLTEQELLDYTISMYFRSYRECLNEELFKQYSLELIISQFQRTPSKFYDDFVRDWTESTLKQTLTMSENRSKEDINQLLNRFWLIYKQEVKEKPEKYNDGLYETYLVLEKV